MRLVYAEFASWKEIVFWRENFHNRIPNKFSLADLRPTVTSTIHFVRAEMQNVYLANGRECMCMCWREKYSASENEKKKI